MAADLTKVSLFEGLKGEDLRALGARTEVRVLPSDAVVIKQGDPADSLLAILRGKVKVYLLDANGQELVVDVRGAGGYVGEMMLDDKPRSAWVKTVEPSELAVIPRNEFKALLLANPELALQIIKNLIRLARGSNVRTLEDVRSRGELQQYIEQLKTIKGRELPSVKRWVVAKRWVMMLLLVFAILQYYFMDVFIEMISMSNRIVP
jgi:CRP/FNR family cyclic AMP-dependent transcriptional regulator